MAVSVGFTRLSGGLGGKALIYNIIKKLLPGKWSEISFIEKEIAASASRAAQKAITGYCRLKAGSNVDLLFKEQGFLETLELCRWQGFLWVFNDMVLVAFDFFRDNLPGEKHDAVFAWLCNFRERELLSYSDLIKIKDSLEDNFPAKSEMIRILPPKKPGDWGEETGSKIYHSLPIHPSLRGDDLELIQNLIRFGAVSLYQELERHVDLQKITERLRP